MHPAIDMQLDREALSLAEETDRLRLIASDPKESTLLQALALMRPCTYLCMLNAMRVRARRAPDEFDAIRRALLTRAFHTLRTQGKDAWMVEWPLTHGTTDTWRISEEAYGMLQTYTATLTMLMHRTSPVNRDIVERILVDV